MPELDGFQLAAMIREHPRFQKTAIIFISAIHLTEVDHLRGYEMGAVDYVPVPVMPEVLRAKVRVFAELYRKTRQLEKLNASWNGASRSAPPSWRPRPRGCCKASSGAAWRSPPARWARGTGTSVNGRLHVGRGPIPDLRRRPENFEVTVENVRGAHPSGGLAQLAERACKLAQRRQPHPDRIPRVPPERRDALVHRTASRAMRRDGPVVRISGVTVDITERKEAEERQALLAREVDHRARTRWPWCSRSSG